MKKSELKRLIRETINRKVTEYSTIIHGENGKAIDAVEEISSAPIPSTHLDKIAKQSGNGAKFAYIVKGQDGQNDPDVILIGYGKLKLSGLKSKLSEGLTKMTELSKQGNAEGVISLWNNITGYVAHGLAELESSKVTEAISTPMGGQAQANGAPAVQINTGDDGKQLSQQDQAKIAQLETEKQKAQNALENTRGELAKKTKPYTDKMNKLEKKIGDTNTAIDRIKN